MTPEGQLNSVLGSAAVSVLEFRSFVDPWRVDRSYGCCVLCEDGPGKEAAGRESEKSDLLMCEMHGDVPDLT